MKKESLNGAWIQICKQTPESPTVKEIWLHKKAFFCAIKGIPTVNDLHVTVLYLLSVDHTKLSYRFGGCDFQLTEVMGT